MTTRNISWEIVLAGLAFCVIGFYLLNQHETPAEVSPEAPPHPDLSSSVPSLPSKAPGTIVLDLENLEQLADIKDSKALKDIENLEADLKKIESVIAQKLEDVHNDQHLKKSLEKVESKLRQLEQGDFDISMQDKKVFIREKYNTEDANWKEAEPGVYIYQKSFSAEDLQSMVMNLEFGNINIEGGDASTATIELRSTGSLEDPAKLSRKLGIQHRLNDRNAFFKTTTVAGTPLSNKINLEATLHLPTDVQVELQTAGGHINAHDLNAKQDFYTSGGHIKLSNISGTTNAKTGGGHITCKNLNGDANLTTGGGHIKVTNAKGALKTETRGGHIEIQQLDGSLKAKTSGGYISASVLEARGPINMYSSAGNISLFLPENIRANLDISGSTTTLADQFDFNGTQQKGKISGTINGGGVDVVASCEYGNIKIDTSK